MEDLGSVWKVEYLTNAWAQSSRSSKSAYTSTQEYAMAKGNDDSGGGDDDCVDDDDDAGGAPVVDGGNSTVGHNPSTHPKAMHLWPVSPKQ